MRLIVFKGLVPVVLEGVSSAVLCFDNGTPFAASEERAGGGAVDYCQAGEEGFERIVAGAGLVVPQLGRKDGPTLADAAGWSS